MADITLNLSVDEINQILTVLGERPFVQVYSLVGKIQDQANAAVRLQATGDRPVENTGVKEGETEDGG